MNLTRTIIGYVCLPINPVMSEKSDFSLDANQLSLVLCHDYCVGNMLECGSLIFL